MATKVTLAAPPTVPVRRGPVTQIGVIMLPSYNCLATSALLDPLRAANYVAGQQLYAWDFISLAGESLIASNGLATSNARRLTDVKPVFDYVFVSSSWTPERHCTGPLKKWLHACDRAGAVLGGIDTGAVLLAAAHLLEGYTATVHYEHLAAFREEFPKVSASEALYVIDRKRWTCCGGLAATDLALEMIRARHGTDLANAAARYIFHDRLRPANEPQRPTGREPIGNPVPKILRRAIKIMEKNLEEPLALSKIAATLDVSQRQLERIFATYAGVSPVRYYLDARLDRARSLATQTDMTVLEIAIACGFRPTHFAKAYRTRFGLTPSKDRIAGRIPFHFRDFPVHAARRSDPAIPSDRG
jgi:transcriptional regulator GlxA family with amidase domain